MEFERNTLFGLACNVRPISGFNPESLLENDYESFRRYLTPDGKLLWFHQYCAENGVIGRVDVQFVSSETLKDIPDSEVVGGIASPVKEYWKAGIYMNETEVASAVSSGTFLVNDRVERDAASNQLRKSAIGAALSQAGFGIISGFDMSEADRIRVCEAMVNGALAKPATVPASVAPPTPAAPTAPVMAPAFPGMAAPGNPAQGSFFGAPQPSPVSSPAPTAPAPQADPLVVAKAVVWNGAGKNKGKTLGQILSEPGGLKNITWIAKDYSPRTAEGKQVQEAAALILQSVSAGA